MNNSILEGNWKVLKGKIREQWAKLTDNDMDSFRGNAEEAVGRLQKVYGYSKDQAHSEYEKFRNSNSSLFSSEMPNPSKSDESFKH